MSDLKNWPDDTDGDVFRILDERNFDFESEQDIEFSIDFRSWPLSIKAQQKALEKLPGSKFIELDEEYQDDDINSGYLSYIIKSRVTYELVTEEQKNYLTYSTSWTGTVIRGVFVVLAVDELNTVSNFMLSMF